MAEFLARRVGPALRLFSSRVFSRRVVVLAVVVAGGAVAGGVALASNGGPGGAASSGGGSPGATAPVMRTDLYSTVQVGGSIGYDGSFTVAAPSGASAQQVAQAQQTVTEDEQALSADEQEESDASAADDQAIAADQTNVNAGESTLGSDQSIQEKACAGAGASSTACSQAEQKVSQDQTQLAQARQQLAAAGSTAKTDDDHNQATVTADETRLSGDRSALVALQATAVNPGTTYTWLPAVGAVIRQDRQVYSVNGEPVPLLYGSTPAYRAFYVGMSDGGDVGELTHDLIALGYGDGLTQSDHYSAATAAAVVRWQQARGLPASGEILLGEVVFEPGPIRVTSVTPSVGTAVGGGSGGSGGGGGGGATVLTATGTTPVVGIDLPVTQEYLVKPGDAVSVVLPNGTTTVGGHVETVGTVATCPGGGSTGTANGGGTADQSPCSSGGSGGGDGSNSAATVPVTITLDSTPPGSGSDQAPVNVDITTQRADNVLAVPVTALLALAGGGYGVDVVTRSTVRLVGVTTGLYSGTLVQVYGPGIAAGERVEVPSQ